MWAFKNKGALFLTISENYYWPWAELVIHHPLLHQNCFISEICLLNIFNCTSVEPHTGKHTNISPLYSYSWWIVFTRQDEFLDVIYWGRQVLGVALGLVWGFIPLKGFVGLFLWVLPVPACIHSLTQYSVLPCTPPSSPLIIKITIIPLYGFSFFSFWHRICKNSSPK